MKILNLNQFNEKIVFTVVPPEDKKIELMKEIGDVLWYCATLANDINATLEQIAQMNIDKLSSRQQRGCLCGNGDNR